MKSFIALFAAVAAAAAEPQFFYNSPVVGSPLAYSPYTYVAAKPVEMKKAEEEEKTDEIKPVVYANPMAYNYASSYYPYSTYSTYAHAPVAYTAPHMTYATPAVTYTAPTIAKVEAVPRYHAKVGDVEHKVYKRSAQFLQTPYTTFPYAHTPFVYSTPLIKPVEKTEEEKEEETAEIKPVVYANPMAYNYAASYYPYSTYTHAPVAYTAPHMTYAAPTIAKYEAIPRYQAKNGDVEHNVYKRSADADPALLYANTFNGYAASPYYPYAGYAAAAYNPAYSTYNTAYSTYTTPYAFSPYRWY